MTLSVNWSYLFIQKKQKKRFSDNHSYNILRLFDVLTSFLFTTSETMGDYYLKTWYIRDASRVAEPLKI